MQRVRFVAFELVAPMESDASGMNATMIGITVE
jgi:hypothetical protein